MRAAVLPGDYSFGVRFQLYLRAKNPVITNGIVEPMIFKFKVSKPATRSNNMRILKQVNPSRLKFLFIFFWKIV
jgi:hypothetical protein